MATLLAGLLGCASVIAGFHALHRGADVEWKFYDPTFLYALPGSAEELMAEGCDEHTVFALGSSVMLAAFDTLPSRPAGRWTLTSTEIDSKRELRILTRYGSTDLRLFYPLIRTLPSCPKTILLHSDVFVARDFKSPKPGDFYFTFVERLRDRVERLWPDFLQKQMRQESIRPVGECDAACLAKRRDAMDRRFGDFHALEPDHLEIVRELVANRARVVILDVGRSERLEAEFVAELERFRAAVESVGEAEPGVRYLAFAPQKNEFYADYTHLNREGRATFGKWIATTAAFRDPRP